MASRPNPGCPLCGGPTRVVPLGAASGWSCAGCGSLTLDAPSARALLGEAAPPAPRTGLALADTLVDEGWFALEDPTLKREPAGRGGPDPGAARASASEAPTQPELPGSSSRSGRPSRASEAPTPPAPPARERSSPPLPGASPVPPLRIRAPGPPAGTLLGLTGAVALVALSLPLAFVVFQEARESASSRRGGSSTAVALVEALGGPAPPVELAEPAPPPPPPDPDPDPEPAPAPAPAPSSLVRRGWDLVDSQPARAAELFEAALGADPADPEAQYGLGYAMLQGGDPSGGSRWLCASTRAGSAELRREVQSLLDHHQLTCSP